MSTLNIVMTVFIIILGAGVWYYSDQATTYQYWMQIYQIQLEAMKNEAVLAEARFEKARKQSLNEMQQVQNKSKEIMNTHIAPGCESAIKFGREQAKILAAISK